MFRGVFELKMLLDESTTEGKTCGLEPGQPQLEFYKQRIQLTQVEGPPFPNCQHVECSRFDVLACNQTSEVGVQCFPHSKYRLALPLARSDCRQSSVAIRQGFAVEGRHVSSLRYVCGMCRLGLLILTICSTQICGAPSQKHLRGASRIPGVNATWPVDVPLPIPRRTKRLSLVRALWRDQSCASSEAFFTRGCRAAHRLGSAKSAEKSGSLAVVFKERWCQVRLYVRPRAMRGARCFASNHFHIVYSRSKVSEIAQ